MLLGVGEIKLVDDAKEVQLVQVFFGLGVSETKDKTPRFAEYGLVSNPPDGSDGVAIFIGGDRSNGIVVATNNNAARLKNLERGEVAIHDDQGRWIWIKRDSIEIEAGGKDVFVKNATIVNVKATTKVVLDTPTVECTGDATVAGTLTATTDVVGGGKSLKNHVHSGVAAGGANTGPPV